MATDIDLLIEKSADPDLAESRYQSLSENPESQKLIHGMEPERLTLLLNLISSSTFLYHLLLRKPYIIELTGQIFSETESFNYIAKDPEELKNFKYCSLFKLSCMDISGEHSYEKVLSGLTILADTVIRNTIALASAELGITDVEDKLAVIGLGKLGASELNYSSDIDLIFVSDNIENSTEENQKSHSDLVAVIREFCKFMETGTSDGFLYRVDLKLRPWGSSGPLFMPLDATEQYYEASSEPWERFAWLRGRVVGGSAQIGNDILKRLHPFVYKRSLSSDDLDKFVQIKHDMRKARKRKGCWNVKLGEGGIRDIEFFAQILQIANGAENPSLVQTNTLSIITALVQCGLLNEVEQKELEHSYLFLRRLENRLQMVDERQTHDLPDSVSERIRLARSLGFAGESNDEILDNFENELFVNQSIATNYFSRVLPQE